MGERGGGGVVVVVKRLQGAERTAVSQTGLSFPPPSEVTAVLCQLLFPHRLETGESHSMGEWGEWSPGQTEMSLSVSAHVLSGAATFLLTNFLTGLLVPPTASQNPQQRWKWRNVATSLVHSVITGTWALAAFYQVRVEVRQSY